MAGRKKHYVRSPRGELLEEGRQTQKAFRAKLGLRSGRQWKRMRRRLRALGINPADVGRPAVTPSPVASPATPPAEPMTPAESTFCERHGV